MAEQWYYASGGVRRGPVSGSELRRLARQGGLNPADLVWRDGLKEWVPARRLQGLFDGKMGKPRVPPPLPTGGRAGRHAMVGPEWSRHPAWLCAGGVVLAILALSFWPRGQAGPGEGGGGGGGDGGGGGAATAPDDLEQRRAASLRAWNALQQADGQIASQTFELPSQQYWAVALAYTQIDLTDVEPVLRDHLVDCIRAYRDAAGAYEPFEREITQLYGEAGQLANFGGLIGRATGGDNPDSNEVAGQLLFGFLGQAAAEQKTQEIKDRYLPSLQAVADDLARVAQRDETVAQELGQIFGQEFIDLY